MGKISGWDISSARRHAGPGEWSATSRLAPCSARLRAHALELEPGRCRRLRKNQATGEVKTRIFPESRFVTCRWLSVAGPLRDQCCERRRERSLLSEPHAPCGCTRASVRRVAPSGDWTTSRVGPLVGGQGSSPSRTSQPARSWHCNRRNCAYVRPSLSPSPVHVLTEGSSYWPQRMPSVGRKPRRDPTVPLSCPKVGRPIPRSGPE